MLFIFLILFWSQEKLALRQQLQEARQQLQQQAEYCTEMGAAACTLLWGVSSSEEVVTAILGGVSVTAGWVAGQGARVCPGQRRLHPFFHSFVRSFWTPVWGPL